VDRVAGTVDLTSGGHRSERSVGGRGGGFTNSSQFGPRAACGRSLRAEAPTLIALDDVLDSIAQG
jgi:hypothetical protein